MNFRILISTLFFFSWFTLLFAQENREKFSIDWVKEIPSQNEDKKSIWEPIGNLILGKQDINIIKPISLLAFSNDSLFVLDQGLKSIISYENGKIKLPLSKSKRLNSFNSLVSICGFNNESFLFTDSEDNKIYQYFFKSEKVKIVFDSIEFIRPTGIAYNPATNTIWVVETGLHQITVLSVEGQRIKQIGERGEKNMQFNFPTDIWIDNEGVAYVIDALNFRVQIFNKNGEFLSSFGKAGDATGSFVRPKGIATDSNGNIYISDALSNVIQVFDKNGNLLHYFGSQGNGKNEFWMPMGIYIDNNDYIYIADSYNSRIQIFKLNRNE